MVGVVGSSPIAPTNLSSSYAPRSEPYQSGIWASRSFPEPAHRPLPCRKGVERMIEFEKLAEGSGLNHGYLNLTNDRGHAHGPELGIDHRTSSPTRRNPAKRT